MNDDGARPEFFLPMRSWRAKIRLGPWPSRLGLEIVSSKLRAPNEVRPVFFDE